MLKVSIAHLAGVVALFEPSFRWLCNGSAQPFSNHLKATKKRTNRHKPILENAGLYNDIKGVFIWHTNAESILVALVWHWNSSGLLVLPFAPHALPL